MVVVAANHVPTRQITEARGRLCLEEQDQARVEEFKCRSFQAPDAYPIDAAKTPSSWHQPLEHHLAINRRDVTKQLGFASTNKLESNINKTLSSEICKIF